MVRTRNGETVRYSAFNLLREAFKGNRGWTPVWRDPEPKAHYHVVIVGGGGHGLATAYYLAKNHGITDVAVLEKGPLGLGNVGRNTTIVRANYCLPGNEPFYAHSLRLWEGLSRELNYNVMFSQRGVLNLCHTPAQRDAFARRGNAIRLMGADADLLDAKEVAALVPGIETQNGRFPVLGGLLQRRAGNARHDAVAWGYARAADGLGVDLLQHCEVTGLERQGDRIAAIETTRGRITADKVGLAVAGNTSRLGEMAGLRLPIESHVLQAFVSEGLKPVLPGVVTFGVGHFYISQSDKGGLVFGGDLDGYNSYAARGNLPLVEHVMAAGTAMLPWLSRVRMLRSWGGIMDMSMDGSPFIGKTPIANLYLNAGWCYGGFKATPGSGWCFAHTIANDAPHELNAPLRLDRYMRGEFIDEERTGPQPNLH